MIFVLSVALPEKSVLRMFGGLFTLNIATSLQDLKYHFVSWLSTDVMKGLHIAPYFSSLPRPFSRCLFLQLVKADFNMSSTSLSPGDFLLNCCEPFWPICWVDPCRYCLLKHIFSEHLTITKPPCEHLMILLESFTESSTGCLIWK